MCKYILYNAYASIFMHPYNYNDYNNIVYNYHYIIHLNCKYTVYELKSQISELEDDKTTLEDELIEAKHMIVQLKSTVEILENKLCKTEGELNEMNDQHVNENRTETVGALNEMHVDSNIAIFLSKLRNRNRNLK